MTEVPEKYRGPAVSITYQKTQNYFVTVHGRMLYTHMDTSYVRIWDTETNQIMMILQDKIVDIIKDHFNEDYYLEYETIKKLMLKSKNECLDKLERERI